MAKQQRLIKIIAKGTNNSSSSSNNREIEEQSDINQHHAYISVDESGQTDEDDGGDSITYVEDYEIAGNSDDTDGDAFFVEYVTEEDLAINAATGDSNDGEIDGQPQLVEYDDDGVPPDGDADEMAMELYNCSSCGMNFKSVSDHIQKHHPDQDVLIDISDENGATAIKTEKTLDLNDDNGDNGDDELILNDDEDVDGAFITTDTNELVDGELVVYGGDDDESMEEGEMIDDVLDENNDSVVYTYDDTTGQITRATTAAKNASKQTAPKIGNVNKSTVSSIRGGPFSFFLLR